nr:hypothetical protein [Candidatus Sigynarchaeota archaeon]
MPILERATCPSRQLRVVNGTCPAISCIEQSEVQYTSIEPVFFVRGLFFGSGIFF